MGTFGNMHPGHGLDWADTVAAQQCNGSAKPPLSRPPAWPLDDGERGDR